MAVRFYRSAALCALMALLSIHLFTASASAQLIDFETTPAGGTPVDDAFLSAPYNISGGGTVSFFFDVNGNNAFDAGTDEPATFEVYGNSDPNPGFANGITGIADTANGGLAGQLGTYFLRQRQPGAPPPAFIVDYNTPATISALQGEIWDIDGTIAGGTEQWLVEILDASNSFMTSQLSPLGSSPALDGLPWVFSFTGLPSGVDKVRITFVGTKTSGLGLAFNNFNPTDVPEPAAVSLALASAACLLTQRRRARSL